MNEKTIQLAEDMERPLYPHYNPKAAQELRRLHAEVKALRAENFQLAAGQCVHATADESGTPMCAEIEALRENLAAKRHVCDCQREVIGELRAEIESLRDKRKPLSNSDALSLAVKTVGLLKSSGPVDGMVGIVRAVEQAHGIKE